MKFKEIKRFLVIILIALIIEIGVINFSNICMLLDDNLIKNKEIMLSNIETINWEKTSENTIVSKLDPMLIIRNINMYVKNIRIIGETTQDIPYIDIFYTNNNIKNFNGNNVIRENEIIKDDIIVEIKKDVNDLRIDLGDAKGTEMNNLKIILNPARLNFNIYRVIAIISIYYLGLFLSYIQKNPNYKSK